MGWQRGDVAAPVGPDLRLILETGEQCDGYAIQAITGAVTVWGWVNGRHAEPGIVHPVQWRIKPRACAGLVSDGISVADVEFRLHRACRTLRSLPRLTPRSFSGAGYWPQMLSEWADLVAQAENPEATVVREVGETCLDDLDVAGAWFAALGRGETRRDFAGLKMTRPQWLVWWRSMGARGVSFRTIAERLRKTSPEAARRQYREAIQEAWILANTGDGE